MGCIVKANFILANTLPVACRWAVPRRRVPAALSSMRRTGAQCNVSVSTLWTGACSVHAEFAPCPSDPLHLLLLLKDIRRTLGFERGRDGVGGPAL